MSDKVEHKLSIKEVHSALGSFWVNVNDIGVSQWISQYGEWAHEEMELIEKYPFKHKRVGVDVGACLGWHSKLLHSIGFSTVLAFEPNPQALPLLERNVGKVATIYPCALGHMEGQAAFRVLTGPTANTGQASLVYNFEDPSVEFSVNMTTLDRIGLEHCDFIKIDCEASDIYVLQGASETIARCRPVILCEANYEPEKLREFLEERNYDVKLHPGYWYRANNYFNCAINIAAPNDKVDNFFWAVPKEQL